MIGDVDGQISIDRSSLSLTPLVIKSDRTTGLTLVSYREPAMQPRIKYAPTSDWQHGDLALGFTYQQVVLSFQVAARTAASEAVARSAIAELVAALGRLSYLVTVTLAGAPAETWTCDPGAVVAVDDRQYADLAHHDPAWQISIPAYPVRSY
jgi:hypothetical protein